jgi:hypothetical protein
MARCHRTDKHARIEARRLKRGLGAAPVDWSGLIDHNNDSSANSTDWGYDPHDDIEDYARWAEATARKAKSIGY